MHRHVCDNMLPAICCSFDKVTMSTTFCLGLILLISNAEISSTSGSAEEKVQDVSHKTLIRNRREELCPDGTYQHERRNCCLCAAGQQVKQHCTSKPDDGICEFCEQNSYSDQPAEMFCKPCTSCDHPNANLETEEACTTARDAKCRCKPDHYCSSNSTGMCQICQPCDTCASSGNKELCARHCKEETRNVGAIVGGILGVAVVLAAVVVGVIYWKRRSNSSSANITPVEMPLHVPEVDMQPLLPDIANNLGWKNMKDLALRSGMNQNVIDTVKLNHKEDYEEMTLDLLGRWVESRGKSASKDLIKKLHDMGKKDTSERILEILKKANPVASSSSV